MAEHLLVRFLLHLLLSSCIHSSPGNCNGRFVTPHFLQLLDRTRHAAVIAAISGGEGSGLLALLLHRAAASLTGAPACWLGNE